MKRPSPSILCAAAGGIAAAAALGAFLLRPATPDTAALSSPYLASANRLRETITAVQTKMQRNALTVPTITVAARLPDPVTQQFAEVMPPDPVSPPPPLPGQAGAAAEEPAEPQRLTVVLQGISWSESSPLVMVGGRLFKRGDLIEGFMIQEILPRSIIVKDDTGRQQEVLLMREEQP